MEKHEKKPLSELHIIWKFKSEIMTSINNMSLSRNTIMSLSRNFEEILNKKIKNF